jgi:hypothetical protein
MWLTVNVLSMLFFQNIFLQVVYINLWNYVNLTANQQKNKLLKYIPFLSFKSEIIPTEIYCLQ